MVTPASAVLSKAAICCTLHPHPSRLFARHDGNQLGTQWSLRDRFFYERPRPPPIEITRLISIGAFPQKKVAWLRGRTRSAGEILLHRPAVSREERMHPVRVRRSGDKAFLAVQERPRVSSAYSQAPKPDLPTRAVNGNGKVPLIVRLLHRRPGYLCLPRRWPSAYRLVRIAACCHSTGASGKSPQPVEAGARLVENGRPIDSRVDLRDHGW